MKIRVHCDERYPFYSVGDFGPEIEVGDMYEWVKKTMAEFEKLQKFLEPRFDRAEARRMSVGKINQHRKMAKGEPWEKDINVVLDKAVEKVINDTK